MFPRLAAILATCWAVGAVAAEGRMYAVLSLIGDKLLVAQQQPTTGTNIPRTLRQVLPFPDPAIDEASLQAVERVVEREDRDAQMELILMREERVLAAQERSLDDGAPVTRLLEPILPRLEGMNATHAIVVSKLRADAVIRLQDSVIGQGKLEGVGFYVDHSIVTEQGQYRQTELGVLAPFAYFRISVVDLARMQVLKEERIVASMARSTAGSHSNNPWDAMSSKEKIEALQTLVRREIERALPGLLPARQAVPAKP